MDMILISTRMIPLSDSRGDTQLPIQRIGAGCSLMEASLNRKGRMAVVLDTGAVARGSGQSWD
jgi:hypothetical protein